MDTALSDSEVYSELSSVAERNGCELIHVHYAGGVLRLVLDRPEGVTLQECETVSRDASIVLDALDFGNGRYTLEVSSPGLDRELYRDHDYHRFTGSRVKVTWRDPETGSKRTDVGMLTSFNAPAENVTASIDLDVGADCMNIRMADVITTRLEPEL